MPLAAEAVLLRMESLVIRAKRGFPSGMTNKESPQRLKPRCRQVDYGTAKAVPLTEPDLIGGASGVDRGFLGVEGGDGFYDG